MRFFYITNPGDPPAILSVNGRSVGALVRFMGWAAGEVEMVRLRERPYVLLRKYVPKDSRASVGTLLRVVDEWDMVPSGDCVVARLDGQDVDPAFDVWAHCTHPFSLYAHHDLLGAAHRSMAAHHSYFSWEDGERGPVIYPSAVSPPPKWRRPPRNARPMTASAAVAQAAAPRARRARTPLVITTPRDGQ